MRTDSLFRIASQSKAIVTVGAMMLVEQGKMLLSDPVSKYLPPDTKVPAVTLQELATHTSGLPRLPANLAPKDVTICPKAAASPHKR